MMTRQSILHRVSCSECATQSATVMSPVPRLTCYVKFGGLVFHRVHQKQCQNGSLFTCSLEKMHQKVAWL